MEGFLSVPIGCSAVVKGEEGSKNPDFCVDVICKRPLQSLFIQEDNAIFPSTSRVLWEHLRVFDCRLVGGLSCKFPQFLA